MKPHKNASLAELLAWAETEEGKAAVAATVNKVNENIVEIRKHLAEARKLTREMLLTPLVRYAA
jgi:hypothetical protein